MKIQSRFQPLLTIDYIINENENKLFDRKSSKIKPTDLAPVISAFANADGGTIVIGIAEKTREVEGIDHIGNDAINNLIAAPKDVCVPMPQYNEEFLQVVNNEGKKEFVMKET